QLFANLISNAIDATPRGRIVVRCHAGHDWRSGHIAGVRITIGDTGTGIPRNLKTAIFDPFFTTKGEAGTGLGLWVCADVVARHGGAITLRSRTKPPSGTVFSVFLPYGHEPQPQPPEPAARPR
ncbi:MAG TPA: HAMP domain-containing sensor histidine kinase, partial [Terriglobales bacterium]|nr:HAMP domain-containing sensor histidine kinase [Terriglobales bacterium]